MTKSTYTTYTLFHLENQNHPPINVNLLVNEHQVRMELDTGAAISVISEQIYKTVLSQQPPLQVSNLQLHAYTGEKLTVLGQVSVNVQYGDQSLGLPVIVVSGTGPNLMGTEIG